MDVTRALDQIAEIHQQIAKGEVYRGYRSLPIAASGLMGLAAAWLQPAGLGTADPIGFVVYWTAIAIGAAFVGSSEIIYNYVVHEDGSVRRQTRKVVGQFLPSVVGGAAMAVCFTHSERHAGAAAARPVGDLLRHRHVRLAAVPAAGERMGRALLLRRRVHAAVERARTGAAHGLVGRRRLRRRASCSPPLVLWWNLERT